MREELEQKLLERFSFYEARSAWTGTKLNFPLGAACSDGWYDIIYQMCEKIEKELEKYPGFEFYFYDIKEKWGNLSIYPSPYPSDSKILKYIAEAERQSETICEYCGSKDNVDLNTNGWWKTLCDKCKK